MPIIDTIRPFLTEPRLWDALGSKGKNPEKPFLEWLKTQPCAKCGKVALADVVDVVPHHIRRVKWGSGTGIKPKFCSVPLCQVPCHTKVETHHLGDHSIAEEGQWEVWRWFYVTTWVLVEIHKRFKQEKDLVLWLKENGFTAP